jgi:hypothetical protein
LVGNQPNLWVGNPFPTQSTIRHDGFPNRLLIKEVVLFSRFALIYIVGAFELGGEIMLRFTSKIEQAIAEGIEQGIAKGRVETYRAWTDWNKRREEAVAKGIPFDEPPPPNPENGIEK